MLSFNLGVCGAGWGGGLGGGDGECILCAGKGMRGGQMKLVWTHVLRMLLASIRGHRFPDLYLKLGICQLNRFRSFQAVSNPTLVQPAWFNL